MSAIVSGGLALAAIAVVWLGFTFNRFIRYRNLMREAWSGVDVQLKRRHDLVPRLVECVKGYRAYEQSVLESLTLARARAGAAQGAVEAGNAETGLTQQMRQFLTVAEAYPDLKASGNFRQLSDSLVETEDQLQYARRYFNGTVRDYNILAESFPSQLVARLSGFKPAAFFEVESSVEKQAPEVKL